MLRNYTLQEQTVYPHSSNYYQDLWSTDPLLLDWSASEIPLYLYKEGCWVNGVQNCTAMCSNSSLIWSATSDGSFNPNVSANVANCVTYLIISNILDLPEDTITSPQSLVNEYGIESARKVTQLKINASVSSCLSNSCDVESNHCGDTDSTYPPWRMYPIGSENITVPSYSSLCLNYNGEINPDIAGIGVLSSYIIAAALLLIMYILIRLAHNLLEYIATPYFFLSDRSHKDAWHHARVRGSKLQQSIASNHHVAILITSLTDFQKGQCIFWLSIDVAVLLGLSGAVNTLNATSVADFRVNQISLQVLCVGAYTCTVFGLYCLHLVGKRSWYVFSLSLITAVVSVAAWGATYTAAIPKIEPKQVAPNLLDFCGPFDPQAYCTTADDYNKISHDQLDSILVGSGGICMLVLLCNLTIHNTRYQTSALAKRLCTCEGTPPRWRLLLRSVLRFTMEMLSIILSAILFQALVGIAFGIQSDGPKWGFGQVLALSIWIPALLEWLYASIRGFENVVEHRLAGPYKIIKSDQTVDTNNPVEYMHLGPPKGGQYNGSNVAHEHFF